MIRCYTLNITILLSISILYAQDIKKDTKVIEQETIVSDTIKKKTEGPEILFNITSCDVGDAIQNTYLTYEFEFSNIGDEPLLVTNVRTSCSCTVASFPKKPILPGETEKIIIELDTKQLGQFNKVAAVYSNAINDYDNSINKSRIVLNIRWKIIEKPE